MPIQMKIWALFFLGALVALAADRDLVYRMPGMDQVSVRSNLTFKTAPSGPLKMDVYLPGSGTNRSWPAIIFVLGDASAETLMNAKDWLFMRSYGRLAGASGLAGVTFNHRSSQNGQRHADVRSDIADAIQFVRKEGPALSIDPERICLWFFSGSGPHLSVGMGEHTNYVRGMVAFYPVLSARPPAGEFSSIDELKRLAPRVPPIFLAKAGRDERWLNVLIDDFRTAAFKAHLPVAFYEHPTGEHAFDILNDDETSRRIIREGLKFAARHL